MNISEFAFNLILIFFPGIMSAHIIDMFTNHKDRTQFQFLINAFLLGFASYLVYAVVVVYIGGHEFEDVNFINSLTRSGTEISLTEMLWVCCYSIVLSVLLIVVHTYKLHFRLFQALGITKKFGEEDVWGFLMNSTNTEWVTIRDLANNIMYDGSVLAFSNNSKEAELLMENVLVFENDSGEFLYGVEAQYLSLDRGNISIEIRTENSE